MIPNERPTETPYERKLRKAREYKVAHKAEIKEWQSAHNAKIWSDPTSKQKKKESNSQTNKKHREKRTAYDRARNPQKRIARQKIRQLIFDGKLERGSCVICGAINAQAHHEDYSKPFEIHWLCPKHHTEAHKNPTIIYGKQPTKIR